MKLKKSIIILLVTIIIGNNIAFATNTADESIEFSSENPAVYTEKEKSDINSKIKIEDAEIQKRIEMHTQETEITIPKKSKKILKSTLKSADEYQGTIEENKDDISSTFVSRDGKNYTYFIDQNVFPTVSIYRYCFETNESIEIYHSDDIEVNDYYIITSNNVYIKDKIIYVAGFSKTDDSHLQILGYNTQTETITYSNTFDISNEEYAESFCIDDNENAYIVINGQAENTFRIKTYNKGGEPISAISQDSFNNYYSIKITNANNNMILIQGCTINGEYLHPIDIAMRVNRGVFVNEKIILLNDSEIFLTNLLYFTFLDKEKTIAYDQYGEIIKFTYTSDSIEISALGQIKIGTYQYFGIPYESSSDESYIYAGAENGVIIRYNWKTYKLERVLSIGTNKTIAGVYKSDGKLFIEYTNSEYDIYALVLTEEEFNTPKQIIELTEHPNLNRNEEEIKAKYEETDIVNKNNYNNIYNEVPSTTAPYKAGSLNEQTKIDTLNQINYFRWLAGVGEVTINEKYMEHAQCGAVLLTTSKELMHEPAQPSDMTDEFYNKAVGATNVEIGIPMSANISRYSPMAESIKGYVDDTNNMELNVGHRLSILDYQATTTSFGFAEKNGTVEMFTDWSKTPDNTFYAWPSPGNFPIESIASQAMWSISYDKTKCFAMGNIDIKLKANGKEYSSANNDFEVYNDEGYNALYYKLPSELITYLTDGKNTIQTNKKVEVELSGLADYQGNAYVIKYPVEFMSVKEKGYLKGDVNGNGTVDLTDYSMILKHVKGIKTLEGEQKERADINQNGSVDLTDYSMVLKHVKGIKLLE